MLPASSLLVYAALLLGLRRSAAQNFLAKPTVAPEARVSNHSDSVSNHSVSNHSVSNHSNNTDVALAAEGRFLGAVWSKLSEPKQEVDWDGLDSGVGAGLDAVTSSLEFAKEPTVVSAGSALTSIGSLAMMAPPPAGPLAGGVMMLVGGLMSIFGDEGKAGPSNEDVLVAMRSGFLKVNEKLDTIDKRLIAVQAQLTLIDAKLDQLLVAVEHVKVVLSDIQEDVKDLVREEVLGEKYLQEIDQEFDVIMTRMRLAMQPNLKKRERKRLMGEFIQKVVEQREALTRHARGVLSPANLEEFLDFELRVEKGKCPAAITYQMMMAVRFKLFFIQFMGSVFSCPDCRKKQRGPKITAASVKYAEDLKKDLLAYEQIVEAKGATDLAQLSPLQMAPGMHAPQYVYDDSLWLGADPVKKTDGHLWRDAAVLPVFAAIPFECSNKECISDTCTKIQRADLMKTLHDPTYKHHGIFGNARTDGAGKTRITVSSKDCESEKVCRTASGSSPKPCKLCEGHGTEPIVHHGFVFREAPEYEHRIQVVPWVGPTNKHQCRPLNPKGGIFEYPRYAKCIRDNGGPKQSCAVEVLTGRWAEYKRRGTTQRLQAPLHTAQLGHVFLNQCFK